MSNKYGAKKVKHDGHVFDSRAEYERYLKLRDMEKHNEITGLEVHPKFALCINGVMIGKGYMRPDFRYVLPTGQEIVEDVKGVHTESWPTRRDLLCALYPSITLVEVRMVRGAFVSKEIKRRKVAHDRP